MNIPGRKAGLIRRSFIYRKSLSMLLVPLLGLGLVMGLFMRSEWEYAREQDGASALVSVMTRVAEGIHALQLERGLSTALIETGTASSNIQFFSARRSVDEFVAGLDLSNDFGSPNIATAIEAARLEFSELDALRGLVGSEAMSGTESFDRYSRIIRALIDVNEALSLRALTGEIHHNIRLLTFLTRLKEAAGMERGLGLGLIGARQGHRQIYRERLTSTVEQQNTYLAAIAVDRELISSIDIGRLETMTERIKLLRNRLMDPIGVAEQATLLDLWFVASSDRMDELRNLEIHFVRGITEIAQGGRDSAMERLIWLAAMLAATVLMSVAAAIRGARSLAHSVRDVTSVLARLSSGDRSVDIDASRYVGEIHDMAVAAASFRDTLLRMTAIVDGAFDAIVTIDAEGRILEFNPSAEAMFGHRAQDAIGRDVADLVIPEHYRSRHRAGLARVAEGGGPGQFGKVLELEALRADGSLFPIELKLSMSRVGGKSIFMAFIADLSERRAALAQLTKVQMAVEQNSASVMITDAKGRIEYVNRRFTEIWGYTFDEVKGQTPRILKSGLTPPETYARLWSTIADGHTWRGELQNRRKNGELIWEAASISPVSIDGKGITHFVAIQEDLTLRKQFEARLLHLAYYDDITGLANRHLALDRLGQALAAATRDGRMVGVLYLDIDHFKNVNESLGHAIGDKLLSAIGQRLKTEIRESDTLARLGGDEFLIVLPHIEAPSYAEAAASRATKLLAAPFLVDGHEIFVTCSIGITVGPQDGAAPLALLQNADAAAGVAKAKGRDARHVYIAEMNETSARRRAIEAQLFHALERGEFSLALHPIVEGRNGRTVGAEALLRWTNAALGPIGPDKFIPVAEDTGLIVPIGDWVIQEACRIAAECRRRPGFADFRVAVNVSARQFRDSRSLVDTIRQALERHDVAPDALEVEVTESITADSAIDIGPALDTLSRLGVRLAIDDFGTGYSSLSYLQRFPFTTLKVDRSFVHGASGNTRRRALLGAIVTMAHGLGLDTVAEGIEAEADLELLKALGCDLMQGYVIAKPMPLADLRDYLGRQRVGLGFSD